MAGITLSRVVTLGGFALALAAGPASAHYVAGVGASPALPVQNEPVTLTVAGVFSDGCERTTSATAQVTDHRILISVLAIGPDPGTACPAVPTRFTQAVAIPGLTPGNYMIDVNLSSTDADLESFPGIAELYVHQRRVPYVLLADSWFMNDCPICDHIPIQLPMTGTFDLLPIGPGDVFDFYDIDAVSFHAKGYDVTALGRYQKSDPPIAGQQYMNLTATVNKEAGLTLQSKLVPFAASGVLPPIDIEISEVTASNVRVYRMRIVAVPLPPYPDLDNDGDVDSNDVAAFISCASGASIPYAYGCDRADFDGDNDVDQSDFGALQRCFSGENQPTGPDCTSKVPHVAASQRSDCKPGNPSEGYPGCGMDEFDFVLQPSAFQVTHRNIVYNCCLTDIQVTLDAGDRYLRLTETEMGGAPCNCMCCFDTTTTVEGLTPGTYTVEYCWLDDKSGFSCETKTVMLQP